MQPTAHENRLIRESSPYLLQHARNPVDWYPWGREAFDEARRLDKPILLSIGYSACHWCHVMERESFENPSIAELMNRLFVNVKVDREERPDVDAIYMNFVQMATGSGGWPLTVFLTPQLVPFYGGTYFPPDDRHGHPAFPRVLESLADAFARRREEVEKASPETLRRLKQASLWSASPGKLDESLTAKAADRSLRYLDPVHGGFGGAPKFPSAMLLGFLLKDCVRRESQESLGAVRLTLHEMAKGGIYDQIGGGFHRYSVDERWLVPHFEKMLYDNALLTRVYLEAYQVTRDPFYRRVVEETLDWVLREMTHKEGGFYSALDADSEGEEGKYYVWTAEEVRRLLGEEDAGIFCDFYDISSAGNFEGQNILHHRLDLAHLSRLRGRSEEDLQKLLDSGRVKLRAERRRRVPPGLDDKVLSAWNGMMLSAFAEAGWVLERRDFQEAATRNALFLATAMRPQGRLLRSWREGEAKLGAYLEDYALVAEGWLSLFQVTGDRRWLQLAKELVEQQIDLFWDDESGDFFFTARDHEELPVRQKEFMDNATPSGNSVSCLNLLKLSLLCGEAEYRGMARRLLERIAGAVAEQPLAFGYWLQAIDFERGPVGEIALVGSGPGRQPLEDLLRSSFLPARVMVSAASIQSEDEEQIPLLQGKSLPEGDAAVFVCQDYACQKPARTPEELKAALGRVST